MLKNLRAMREDRDLKQRDLAELLCVHQTTYPDYELGNMNIPNAQLIRLADYFGTSVDYLLDRTDDPRPYPRRR